MPVLRIRRSTSHTAAIDETLGFEQKLIVCKHRAGEELSVLAASILKRAVGQLRFVIFSSRNEAIEVLILRYLESKGKI